MVADRYLCRACSSHVVVVKGMKYRSHTNDNGRKCEMVGEVVPKDLLDQGPLDAKARADVPAEGQDFATCPECGRKVKLSTDGCYAQHDKTLRGGDQCPLGGKKVKLPEPGRTNLDRLDQLQDVSVRMEGELIAHGPVMVRDTSTSTATSDAGSNHQTQKSNSPELTTISSSSPEESEPPSISSDAEEGPVTADQPDLDLGPFPLAESVSRLFLQPFSPFSQPSEWSEPRLEFLQPPEYAGPEKPEEMSAYAKELATRIKETFYAYSNRKTKDNRSAQATLGPSEIGTPCDRRLAMALMGVPAVNPGGDGWPAFVGTCTHVGMGEVYVFADAGTGRYAVELRVELDSPSVPHGTTDLLDRRDGTVTDWKVMGQYSLKKFKLEGPSPRYRTQAHVYGLGAELAGEKVRNVAIVGLPRGGSSLDEMHVWTEKYDRKFARAALQRVERIANKTRDSFQVDKTRQQAAAEFETGDDCRYCPFFLKGDRQMKRGCPGV